MTINALIDTPTTSDSRPSELSSSTTTHVIRRDGTVSAYDTTKISTAMTKAFLEVEGTTAGASARVRDIVEELTAAVALFRHGGPEQRVHIEEIQDQVELALMRGGHHKVARAYVLYREEHARARKTSEPEAVRAALHVRGIDGELQPLDEARLIAVVQEACADLDGVAAEPILEETRRNLYDGMSVDELNLAVILAARSMVEKEPNYSQASARLLLDKLRREALTFLAPHAVEVQAQAEMAERYPKYFKAFIARGIEVDKVDRELARFDLDRLAAALRPERDRLSVPRPADAL